MVQTVQDTVPACRVAEACVTTLQEMNPFVRVTALPGSVAAALVPDTLRQFHVVLVCGQPADVINLTDRLCGEAGVAFYAATSRGIAGWAFANLHEHSYVVEASCGWVRLPGVGALRLDC